MLAVIFEAVELDLNRRNHKYLKSITRELRQTLDSVINLTWAPKLTALSPGAPSDQIVLIENDCRPLSIRRLRLHCQRRIRFQALGCQVKNTYMCHSTLQVFTLRQSIRGKNFQKVTFSTYRMLSAASKERIRLLKNYDSLYR